MSTNNFIFFSIIVLGLAVYFFTKNNSSGVATVTNDNSNIPQTFPNEGTLQKNIKDAWLQTANNICVNFSLFIDPKAILATIEQESGARSLSENSSTIIGDNGHSIGMCQVSQTALYDINNYFGTSYVFTDLNDNTNNLTCGLLYLDMCLNIDQSKNNAYWLAYKRYNGGRDETDTSNNSMATNYANQAYTKYQIYLQG